MEVSAFNMVKTGGAVTSMAADEYMTTPLFACIDPSWPGMFDMPFDYFWTFVNRTNFTTYYDTLGDNTDRSFGLNFYALLNTPVDNR